MEKELKQDPINIVKVVLFGPESTGKTTLSRQLARHYNTVWAPEFAREYLQDKWNNERKTCEKEDLLPIAIGQMKLENSLAKKADKILICDTDLLETKVYSEEFYGGFVDDKLNEAASKNQYDLYLLTYIDTPWEADDLRDRPEERLEMFKAFENALIKNKRSYLLLKGDKETRLKNATEAINKIIESKDNLHSFSDSLIDLDMHFLHQNSSDFGNSLDY
ncbi:ATP-binding protein [uncultured Polaribacter sp.]|uniref:ATP-binding protein n=1 Tax=uncultured Polaribacter sp. TaxID=174711 RepID=UPI0026247B99|nr:ATP-binding protein [uncultured Polaribacter sp.]